MKKILFITLLFFFGSFLIADNKSKYLELLNENKLTELFEHLQKWEKSEPQNPEVYIGYFNYYIRKGSKSGVAIKKYSKSNKEQIVITDPETGEIVGYLTDTIFYDYEEIQHAFEYLDKGLKYGPNRLDMYFGKMHLLNEIEDYEKAGKTLINILNISIKNNNKWLWSDNTPIEDAERFFLDTIQDYYNNWFNAQTEYSLEAIRVVSIEQIKLYPSNIYGYNNLGTYHATKKQYDEALVFFLKAEEIDENDIIVLFNIAHCYKVLDNKKMAKQYYEKIIEIGDKEAVEYAKKMLAEL
jgi:tetratricopeptide (TPR) repeat protein